jgi:hypothetical protein
MATRVEGPVTREELRTVVGEELTRMPEKTWKPVTGGLLGIISGYLNILSGILVMVGYAMGTLTLVSLTAGIGIGAFMVALGIVSVIGGAFAIRRRAWGMALAGSIVSLFPSLSILPGTFSLIWVTLGRSEFRKYHSTK